MHLPASLLSMIAAYCVLAAVFYLLGCRDKRKQPRPTFSPDPRSGPGKSWLAELGAINKDLRRYYLLAVFSPVSIFAVHLSQSYFGGAAESSARLAVSAGGGLSFCLFSTYKIVKLLNQRRAARLG